MKKTDYRRYALVGLIISLAAIVVGMGVLVAKGLAFTGLYFPSKPELINQIGIGAAVGFVLGLAIYALLDPDKAREFLTGRQAQYGSNSIIMFLAFLGIVVVANVLTHQNPQKWDVTEDQSNTLAAETVQTLEQLPQPITATAFFSSSMNRVSATKLFDEFKNSSNGKFTYEFIDPVANPVAANDAGITQDGEVVLSMGDQRQTISNVTEQEITSSLIRLMNPQQAVIYFVTGDGERDTETAGNSGFTQVRSALENRNYVVRTLNLQAEKNIPADARVIVVAGPLKPLTQEAVTLLEGYLNNGGALIVMEDPIPSTEFGESPDPLAELLSTKWGITLNNDLVIDPNSPNNPLQAVGVQYAQFHPITARMSSTMAVVFPIARSLSIDTALNPNMQPVALAQTIDQAWGEHDFESVGNNQISFDANADRTGPITLAAAAEDSVTQARVAVFGNSSFAIDANLSAYGNNSFLTNTVDWAANQENLLNLTTKAPMQRQYKAPGAAQLLGSIILVVCLLPLMVIGAGVASWIVRRRRG